MNFFDHIRVHYYSWNLVYRREEKLYVEGMEDEDMKKETQNLAYPPAFKLGKIFINWCHITAVSL